MLFNHKGAHTAEASIEHITRKAPGLCSPPRSPRRLFEEHHEAAAIQGPVFLGEHKSHVAEAPHRNSPRPCWREEPPRRLANSGTASPASPRQLQRMLDVEKPRTDEKKSPMPMLSPHAAAVNRLAGRERFSWPDPKVLVARAELEEDFRWARSQGHGLAAGLRMDKRLLPASRVGSSGVNSRGLANQMESQQVKDEAFESAVTTRLPSDNSAIGSPVSPARAMLRAEVARAANAPELQREALTN